MKIAYCVKCSPVAIMAVGDFPLEVAVRGKKVKVLPHHTVAGVIHESKVVEAGNLPQNPGERAEAYMKRILKEHAEKLK